jgi:hypothetical protein
MVASPTAPGTSAMTAAASGRIGPPASTPRGGHATSVVTAYTRTSSADPAGNTADLPNRESAIDRQCKERPGPAFSDRGS